MLSGGLDWGKGLVGRMLLNVYVRGAERHQSARQSEWKEDSEA